MRRSCLNRGHPADPNRAAALLTGPTLAGIEVRPVVVDTAVTPIEGEWHGEWFGDPLAATDSRAALAKGLG